MAACLGVDVVNGIDHKIRVPLQQNLLILCCVHRHPGIHMGFWHNFGKMFLQIIMQCDVSGATLEGLSDVSLGIPTLRTLAFGRPTSARVATACRFKEESDTCNTGDMLTLNSAHSNFM